MAGVIDIRDASAHQARFSLAGDMLRAVHAEPGITRARLARRLGMSSGVAADTVRRLVALELLIEGPAIATGARGRPTRSLGPHPHGPLAAVAAVLGVAALLASLIPARRASSVNPVEALSAE